MTVEDQVRGYACEAAGRPPEGIRSVSHFEGGNRHAVYRVACLDASGTRADLVVRVSHGGTAADCAEAEREARVLEKVGGLAGPLLYDFRCTSSWFETPAMCMQFIRGHKRDLSSASSAELERLGSLTGSLHTLPGDDLTRWLGPTTTLSDHAEDRLQSILSGMAWVRDPLPAPIRDRLSRAAESLERSWAVWQDTGTFATQGENLVLLHGDPGPGNILWGPDPVMIDWEYARLGDPADEIAYLFDQNDLDGPRRQAFWRGYRDRVGSHSPLAGRDDRVSWWEPVTLLGSTLWWVERWTRRIEGTAAGTIDPAASRDPDYYFAHIIRRLDRLDSRTISRRER